MVCRIREAKDAFNVVAVVQAEIIHRVLITRVNESVFFLFACSFLNEYCRIGDAIWGCAMLLIWVW